MIEKYYLESDIIEIVENLSKYKKNFSGKTPLGKRWRKYMDEDDPTLFTEFVDGLDCRLEDTFSKEDLHIMGFHPEYGAEDADLDFLYEHEWESAIEKEYAMMFIQSLSKVDDASLKLEKLGYYNVYPSEEYQTLVVDRRKRRTRQWQ